MIEQIANDNAAERLHAINGTTPPPPADTAVHLRFDCPLGTVAERY